MSTLLFSSVNFWLLTVLAIEVTLQVFRRKIFMFIGVGNPIVKVVVLVPPPISRKKIETIIIYYKGVKLCYVTACMFVNSIDYLTPRKPLTSYKNLNSHVKNEIICSNLLLTICDSNLNLISFRFIAPSPLMHLCPLSQIVCSFPQLMAFHLFTYLDPYIHAPCKYMWHANTFS